MGSWNLLCYFDSSSVFRFGIEICVFRIDILVGFANEISRWHPSSITSRCNWEKWSYIQQKTYEIKGGFLKLIVTLNTKMHPNKCSTTKWPGPERSKPQWSNNERNIFGYIMPLPCNLDLVLLYDSISLTARRPSPNARRPPGHVRFRTFDPILYVLCSKLIDEISKWFSWFCLEKLKKQCFQLKALIFDQTS